MTRVFSGMQPTGGLHLGNHLGALVNWVRMQDTADVTYCVVDLHAITMGHDPAILADRTLGLAMEFVAAGVDPDRSTLFVQSHLGDVHAEMTWLFSSVTGVGELQKMPQYREKSERVTGKHAQVTAGLLTYPVLQTSDILLYDADEVPVGEDQRHHIEIARDIGGRFNHRYGDVFVLPRAIFPEAAARVMDLQDPTAKMSASADSDKGRINLQDDPDRILKKVRSAQTDSGRDVAYDRADKAGISNLLEVMSAATGRSIDDLVEEYADAGYGTFKGAVAEAVVELLRPMQERHAELAADPGEMQRILADGAAKAREVSAPRLAAAKDAMGFLPA
ncbi:tryptophan--tRNA ligase [Salsipaludibacter albus]|uniref:tryptophan--tRNA ligase n=1 Tax=Salsipaludibacter albus TaxID=2849650 RepID=UPI001EE3BD54|nr:tryptophan--tRNA ligase [Salsipaludibacter albus]